MILEQKCRNINITIEDYKWKILRRTENVVGLVSCPSANSETERKYPQNSKRYKTVLRPATIIRSHKMHNYRCDCYKLPVKYSAAILWQELLRMQ